MYKAGAGAEAGAGAGAGAVAVAAMDRRRVGLSKALIGSMVSCSCGFPPIHITSSTDNVYLLRKMWREAFTGNN